MGAEGKPGKRYLKILHEDLLASTAWKALEPAQQGEQLRMLIMHAVEGKLPERWARLASLRQVGVVPKRTVRSPNSKYATFGAAWEVAWEERRGEKYVWTPRARAGIRQAHEICMGDLLAFQARVRLLWAHRNAWYQENASPNLLASHWNELGGGPKTARVQAPPIPQEKPKEVCAYCGHWEKAYGACPSCRRPWKGAAP